MFDCLCFLSLRQLKKKKNLVAQSSSKNWFMTQFSNHKVILGRSTLLHVPTFIEDALYPNRSASSTWN